MRGEIKEEKKYADPVEEVQEETQEKQDVEIKGEPLPENVVMTPPQGNNEALINADCVMYMGFVILPKHQYARLGAVPRFVSGLIMGQDPANGELTEFSLPAIRIAGDPESVRDIATKQVNTVINNLLEKGTFEPPAETEAAEETTDTAEITEGVEVEITEVTEEEVTQ